MAQHPDMHMAQDPDDDDNDDGDDDEDKNEIIDVIMDSAQTGEEGNSGDGRIFVVPIEEAYTISTRSNDD